ncbi:hypothetical protein VJI72_07725 [Parvimonas micra]|uniref:hypothetical protein n=1 Tax=Parvimonas TaxID=543311 RepID=UPI002B4959FE|nr:MULTISPECIES: hypothetical protein [Parvimonas]MEB3029669.1 hypothetical protein [Parvimonas micra]MEB3067284.1 hypothetical protein [Parvimonas micra]MEB3089981.1 hypothetical protein [Parvimonas sp. M20]
MVKKAKTFREEAEQLLWDVVCRGGGNSETIRKDAERFQRLHAKHMKKFQAKMQTVIATEKD